MKTLEFLSNFIKHPGCVGAIAPSTENLAVQMVAPVNLDKVQTIVEYGPGTGVFTKYISKRINHDKTMFFSLEIDDKMFEVSTQAVPDVEIIKDSASNVCDQLKKHGKDYADAIISGLPFAIFPYKLQDEIIEATVEALPKGGIFTTFTYFHGFYLPGACRIRKVLKMNFSEFHLSPIVWNNFPPAIVYWCKK